MIEECNIQQCSQHPDCNVLRLDTKQSRKGTSVHVEVTMKRQKHEKFENHPIIAQAIRIVDENDEKSGAEEIWHFSRTEQNRIKSIANFETGIETAPLKCAPEDSSCTWRISNLKLKKIYSIILVLFSNARYESGILHEQRWHCPKEILATTEWQCINSTSIILASQLCDSEPDCEDKSDEASTLCKGDWSFVLVIGLLSLFISFTAAFIVWVYQRKSMIPASEEDEENEDEKLIIMLEDSSQQEFEQKFNNLSLKAKLMYIEMTSIVDKKKMKTAVELINRTLSTKKILKATNSTQLLRNYTSEPSCDRRLLTSFKKNICKTNTNIDKYGIMNLIIGKPSEIFHKKWKKIITSWG